VDAIPANILRRARGWDLAATEAEDDDDLEKSGPDFTATVAGAKLSDGRYIITDMRRWRETPLIVEQTVCNTASQDGRATSIYMEQEPGSGGKNTISHYSRLLGGYIFHGVTASGKGSKVERSRPWSAQAEAGNILILRTPETENFLNELEAFPNPRVHDDWVDGFNIMMSGLNDPNVEDMLGELASRRDIKEKMIEQEETFGPNVRYTTAEA